MEKHDPTQAIVLNSWGSMHVFPCHVDVAHAIFRERVEQTKELRGELFSDDMLALFQQPILHFSRETLDRAFRECMGEFKNNGLELPTLRRLCFGSRIEGEDTRPAINWNLDLNREFLHWCVDHDIQDWKQAHQLCSLEDLRELSWFKTFETRRAAAHPGKGIALVDGYYYDKYIEYKTLDANRWKDTALAASVVQRYLAFINDNLCHRDERYDLGTLELGYSKYLELTPATISEAPSI